MLAEDAVEAMVEAPAPEEVKSGRHGDSASGWVPTPSAGVSSQRAAGAKGPATRAAYLRTCASRR